MALSKKNQLIVAAVTLFERGGIQATGIEKILKTASVAKRTLYTHFKSKNELTDYAVTYVEETSFHALVQAVMAAGDTHKGRLKMFFPVLEGLVVKRKYNPTLLLRTIQEFTDQQGKLQGDQVPVRALKVAKGHTLKIKALFIKMARESGFEDPEDFAESVLILMNGAISLHTQTSDVRLFRKAHCMLQDLIEVS